MGRTTPFGIRLLLSYVSFPRCWTKSTERESTFAVAVSRCFDCSGLASIFVSLPICCSGGQRTI